MKRILSCILLIFMFLSLIGCNKDMEKEESIKISKLNLNQASFTEGDFKDRFDWNVSYIKHLDLDRLLYWYRYYGGVLNPQGVSPYPDWESGRLWYGIMIGHYLSACAMLYPVTNDEWFLNRVNETVDKLEECQKPSGLLFAMEEERFDMIENGSNINEAGPAFYYVHKVLAGLVDAYNYCGNNKALDMAVKLADWTYQRVKIIEDNGNRLNALSVEYGGITEPLYMIYDLTKDQKALEAAHFFQEKGICRYWVNKVDNLFGIHANTTIPKTIGFVCAYLHGEGDEYLEAAKFFFDTVVSTYMYPNGATSGGEAFNKLYFAACHEIDSPSETCTAYNLIKLARYLYEITEDPKYLDFIERSLLNAIMGSIEEDGCKTYYQHMHDNATRVYNPYDGGMWCCVGTGLENFALAASMLYYQTDDLLDINILISSNVKTKDGVEFKISNNDEKSIISVIKGGKAKVRIRIPRWTTNFEVILNGSIQHKKDGEFILLDREFKESDQIEVNCKFNTKVEWLDEDDIFVLKYGPYQMVSLENGPITIAGTKDEGWMVSPDIYKEGENYYLNVNDKTILLKKYGTVTHEKFTTFFKRVD